jgi:hypothetical protein
MTLAWNNTAELGRLIECFNRQTHGDRELIVLDDAGQYPDQPAGDRWHVVSVPRRFSTIGAKRAACVGLLSLDVDVIAVWDSDDVYLPWALASVAAALDNPELDRDRMWAQARVVLEWDSDGAGPGWHAQETFSHKNPFRPGYHSAWAFRQEAYLAVKGYPPSAHEDWPMAEAMLKRFGPSADSTPDGRPWMAYSRGPWHLSSRIRYHADNGAGGECFTRAWEERVGEVVTIQPVDLRPFIRWDRDYSAIPIPSGPAAPRPW